MTQSQFIHLSRYGRIARKGSQPWETMSGILAEAARAPGAHDHVGSPQPIRIILGASPIDYLSEAEALAQAARDSKGRSLRTDGGVLVAGVASYPMPYVHIDGDPVEGDCLSKWEQETEAFLRKTFGPGLRYVVAHSDEPYPHLHFGVLPTLAPDQTLEWEQAHPGVHASRIATAAGASTSVQNAAYVFAMRKFQDDYHASVGAHLGQARVGPRRARLSRMEHQEQKRIHELKLKEREVLREQAITLYARVSAKAWNLYRERIQGLEAQNAEMKALIASLEAEREDLLELLATFGHRITA